MSENEKRRLLAPRAAALRPPKEVFRRGLGDRVLSKKGKKTFSEVAKDILESTELEMIWKTKDTGPLKKIRVRAERGFYHHLVGVLVIEGMRGNLAAIKELMDRTEGRPQQSVSLDVHRGKSPDFEDMTPEERWAFINEGMTAIRRCREQTPTVLDAEFEPESGPGDGQPAGEEPGEEPRDG